MRGKDEQQLGVIHYVSPELRVPQDHPLAGGPHQSGEPNAGCLWSLGLTNWGVRHFSRFLRSGPRCCRHIPRLRVVRRPLLKSKKRDSPDKSPLRFFITPSS